MRVLGYGQLIGCSFLAMEVGFKLNHINPLRYQRVYLLSILVSFLTCNKPLLVCKNHNLNSAMYPRK